MKLYNEHEKLDTCVSIFSGDVHNHRSWETDDKYTKNSISRTRVLNNFLMPACPKKRQKKLKSH